VTCCMPFSLRSPAVRIQYNEMNVQTDLIACFFLHFDICSLQLFIRCDVVSFCVSCILCVLLFYTNKTNRELCDANCSDVERSLPEDYHDRHADRSAVVHLRRREGLLPSSSSSATRNARVAEEETRKGGGRARQRPLSLWSSVCQ